MPKREMTTLQHVYAIGGWRAAISMLFVILYMKGIEVTTMVGIATIPEDILIPVLAIMIVFSIVGGVAMFARRYKDHCEEIGKKKDIAKKYIVTSVIGVAVAFGLTYFLAPIAVTKIYAVPGLAEYGVFAFLFAVILGALGVWFFEDIVSSVKYVFEKASNVVDAAADGMDALSKSVEKMSEKEFTKFIAEQELAEKKKAYLDSLNKPKEAEVPKAEEIA